MKCQRELAGRERLSISGGVMAATRACIRGLSVPQLLCPLLILGPPSNSPLISSRELQALSSTPDSQPSIPAQAKVFWNLRGLYKLEGRRMSVSRCGVRNCVVVITVVQHAEFGAKN